MTKFDVLAIGGAHFLLVQSEHLLDLPSTILVPVLPRDDDPGLRGLTVDISIKGRPYRIAAHMPVTVEPVACNRRNRCIVWRPRKVSASWMGFTRCSGVSETGLPGPHSTPFASAPTCATPRASASFTCR